MGTLSARNVLFHKPATVLSQFDSFTLFENFCSVFRRKTFKMTEERVQSKNLFNFRPQGFIDPEVVFYDEKMKKDFGLDPQAMEEEMKNQTEAEFVGGMREFMDGFLGNTPFATGPAYVEAYASCDNTVLEVPTKHDGEYSVKVLVHTPKSLAGEKNRPAIVYAHGGGCVGGSADMYKGFLAHMALDCRVVVFNVDYRLAPETRCPNNVLDFYEAIKYVSANAADLGVDPARICMAGESGGGYICSGAMVQLALKEEASLVKIAIPVIPMLDDYEFSCPLSMTAEESESALMMQKIWQAIAGPDFESKRKDPLLFPGKASPELLAKMPPALVWEDEFDMYITPATRFAHKLRTAGRLLEFVCIPGAKHDSGMMPQFSAIWKLAREAWRVAIQEYLVKSE